MTWRGLSQEDWRDVAQGRGLAPGQVRKRFIRERYFLAITGDPVIAPPSDPPVDFGEIIYLQAVNRSNVY